VSEGLIGYDRIIKMLTVHNGDLMVEEKAIYSIEKFLVARRLMYWQVYLHKTVVAAEMMLVNIIKRAKELINNGFDVTSTSLAFDFFLTNETDMERGPGFERFCLLDDYDVMATIKKWMEHPDRILSTLCRLLIDRRLLKVKLRTEPFDEEWVNDMRMAICKKLNVTEKESRYFIFTGEAENTTYDPSNERINILFKDETVRDISEVDNALIHHTLSIPVKKFYICFFNI
jgi:HD superfamily phosphohydrolase